MKVCINTDTCVGIGQCEAGAPHLFEVGDDGQAHLLVDEIDEADFDAVRRAVEDCPTSSLSIEE
ncbi:ferredoxin [Gordonia sp. ABSL1-1]|uniref:ferredoxin n=1 Tax=Gordonia sp. ABSL1-1 TaxID=3053923 RepID=UPI00257258B7|nr:ferredoxin [Gordonia sp. ABSL1-1]MDL9936057.1 ferredoxin [Gordonia sp. ABSL1-1]